jgi:hypothetical protein
MLMPWQLVWFIEDVLTDSIPNSDWGWHPDDESLIYYCEHNSKLPTIDFRVGEMWFEVTASDYVVDYGDTTCGLCFSDATPRADVVVIGNVLLKDYYAVHDSTNMEMGFGLLTGGSKIAPAYGSLPTCRPYFSCSSGSGSSSREEQGLNVVVLVLVLLVFVALPLFALWWFVLKPKPDSDPAIVVIEVPEKSVEEDTNELLPETKDPTTSIEEDPNEPLPEP